MTPSWYPPSEFSDIPTPGSSGGAFCFGRHGTSELKVDTLGFQTQTEGEEKNARALTHTCLHTNPEEAGLQECLALPASFLHG